MCSFSSAFQCPSVRRSRVMESMPISVYSLALILGEFSGVADVCVTGIVAVRAAGLRAENNRFVGDGRRVGDGLPCVIEPRPTMVSGMRRQCIRSSDIFSWQRKGLKFSLCGFCIYPGIVGICGGINRSTGAKYSGKQKQR